MHREIHVLVMNLTDQQSRTELGIFIDGQGPAHYGDLDPCPIPHPGPLYGDMFNLLPVEVVLPHPGFYELVFPASTPCAEFGHSYFIKIFGDAYGPGFRFVVDDEPRLCAFMYFGSMGPEWWWWDVHDGIGSPLWWVEAQCCEPAPLCPYRHRHSFASFSARPQRDLPGKQPAGSA